MVESAASQAAYEGSIPFARSKTFHIFQGITAYGSAVTRRCLREHVGLKRPDSGRCAAESPDEIPTDVLAAFRAPNPASLTGGRNEIDLMPFRVRAGFSRSQKIMGSHAGALSEAIPNVRNVLRRA